jgi:predicted RNase H-like nuclease (RuvC/YqgF family)
MFGLSDLEARMRKLPPKDEMIRVRIESSEKRQLAALARRTGTTISQILRDGAKAFEDRAAA